MRIWKWTLSATDRQVLSVPQGAKFLTVQLQAHEPQLWALVDETAPEQFRTISIYGTGNPMPDGDPGVYLGTFQMHDGALVFHVFETTTP